MSRRLRTNTERLNGPSRIVGIDLARGLAILGMFAAHLLDTGSGLDWSDPGTWLALVDGRSSILFAMLAGVSIGLVTGGRTPLTGPQMSVARGRVAIRAAVLLLLGILLILTGVPVFVILPAYAILFLIVIPFTGLPARTVLWLAAGLALVMPIVQPMLDALPIWSAPFAPELDALIGWHYPFTLWIVFVLAGLGIARSGVTSAVVQVRMLIAGTALAVLGYGLALVPDDGLDMHWALVLSAEPHSGGLPEVVGSGGFAIATLAACLLLCRLRVLKTITLPLRATGAMPLSAYTAQLVVWAIIAGIVLGDTDDLMGFRALEPFWPMTIITLIACTAWALLIGRGPLEWALDRAAKFVVSAPPRR